MTHNAGHELTGFDGQTVQHDAKGNRLTSLISGDTQPYLWDQDNRLTTAGDYHFEYDALGRRVFMSRFDSATQTFQKDALIYNDQQLIATYRQAGSVWNVTRTFVYGSYIDEPLLMESAGQQLFFNRNQQYSITALTDASGSVVERYVYDAYGETTVLSPGGTPIADSAFGNPFTYTGRFNHAQIGLMYFRARYYDPKTGEFISRDPLGYVDGMSLYRGYFVPGAMDPLGRQTLDDDYVEPDPSIYTDIFGPHDDLFEEVDAVVNCNAGIEDLKKIKHPEVERALKCNVKIYCGKCGGLGGVAHYVGQGGYAFVCINKNLGKGVPRQRFEALVIHEMVHVGQYLDSGKCGCKDKPFRGRRPAIPPNVGGDDCESCKAAESPAYQAQAEHLYPKGEPGAAEFHRKFVEQGLLYSCRDACKTSTEPRFPDVPFPL